MRAMCRIGAGLGVVAVLGACQMAALPPILDPAPADPGLDAPAQRAVAACLSQAETQGFEVRGVADATEVVDGADNAVGQNVFVDIGRAGQAATVRCSYTYATSQARVMTL